MDARCVSGFGQKKYYGKVNIYFRITNKYFWCPGLTIKSEALLFGWPLYIYDDVLGHLVKFCEARQAAKLFRTFRVLAYHQTLLVIIKDYNYRTSTENLPYSTIVVLYSTKIYHILKRPSILIYENWNRMYLFEHGLLYDLQEI